MTSTSSPLLFDRALLCRRHARAAADFAAHDFLFRLMAERLRDRLDDMTRHFPLALALDRGGAAAHVLAAHRGIGRLIESGVHAVLDEEVLPFRASCFDAVFSCGTLHWVNDIPGALAQIRRCLKPDGLFLSVFPGGDSLKELRDALLQASLAEEGGVAPRVSPFVDVRDAGALLQRAGFALPVVDSETLTVRYGDAFALMRDLRGMGETNALLQRPKRFTRRATMQAADAQYRARYQGEDGRIPATFELITLTAWQPHESQPQPLRRGSGEIALGQVLR